MQGQTRRWAIAWSFGDAYLLDVRGPSASLVMVKLTSLTSRLRGFQTHRSTGSCLRTTKSSGFVLKERPSRVSSQLSLPRWHRSTAFSLVPSSLALLNHCCPRHVLTYECRRWWTRGPGRRGGEGCARRLSRWMEKARRLSYAGLCVRHIRQKALEVQFHNATGRGEGPRTLREICEPLEQESICCIVYKFTDIAT